MPDARPGVIVLYGPRDVPPVRKVALGLQLKGTRYELREPETRADYRRFSPETGRLPVLEIDGERRPDSNAILAWLDELFPSMQKPAEAEE